jgi:predicted MPP superfamily phosphohydrolase/tetratricopeptide (TPR) repeat protein
MNPDDKYLRYLHLSDLHFSSGDMKGDKWVAKALDQDIVTKTMLDYIKNLEKKLDFIIVTGDIAQSGKREEYEVAEEFFLRLHGATNLEPKNTFVVPGNHDLDRSKIKKWDIKGIYQFENQDDITAALSDEDGLKILLKKFEAFNDFAEIVMGRRLFKDTTYHMVDSLSIEKAGQKIKVALAGLNSALFSGYDGDDKQRLALGLQQVHRALDQLDKEAHLSIGFFHHPFECFHKDDDVCKKMLKDKLDLILTGHTHEPDNNVIRDAGAKVTQVSAGAGFEKRKFENSFNIVEFDLETGQGNVEFHKYLQNNNCWNKNYDLNPKEKDGTFKFKIEEMKGLVEKTDESSPTLDKVEEETKAEIEKTKTHFIHSYTLPVDFTGRQEELKRLEKIACKQVDPVTKNQSVLTTVRAIGGTGKSCLIRELVDRVPEDSPFSYVIWFSFYEARTEDLGFFFQEVLECLGKLPKSSTEGQIKVRELRKALCSVVEENPILLILDGLEVIQSTEDKTSPHYGEIAESHKEIKEFLSRICNQKKSSVVVTSRVSLRDFDGVSGYVEIPLETFSPESGGQYLDKLGVTGTKEELETCAKTIGGHILCLKAAGKFMKRKSIPASEIDKVVGDQAVFEKTTQGEKVHRLYTNYLEYMSGDQKYFLERMSIHMRSVTSVNFPVLVRNYGKAGRDEGWVREHVVDELEELGLIEVLNESNGLIYYSAHPLMKFAFASTMNEDKRRITHEDWAKAAEQAPGNKSASSAKSLENLQPYLDAIEHYLEARNYEEAWRLFGGDSLAATLQALGYSRRMLEIAKKLESAMDYENLNITISDKTQLYKYLAMSSQSQDLESNGISYRIKALQVAKDAGNEYWIDFCKARLIGSYVDIGDIDNARKLKTKESFALGCLELNLGNFENGIKFLRKSIKEDVHLGDKNISLYIFGESLRKVKKIAEAEKTLFRALEIAKKQGFLSQISSIFEYIIKLELGKGNINEARFYQNKRLEMMKASDLIWEDHPFLLIAEGRFDETIHLSEKYVSSRVDRKLNKAKEIESLLALSQAWHGKGNQDKPRDYMERARALMEKTGCWFDKDILEETEAMLAKVKG